MPTIPTTAHGNVKCFEIRMRHAAWPEKALPDWGSTEYFGSIAGFFGDGLVQVKLSSAALL
jgi:hypothetical protein